MNKKGLSLIEILVSCVILALVLTGLVNIFIASKRYILHSRSRMTASELGRFFLDPLQMQVRQDTWDQAGNLLRIPDGQEDISWTETPENLSGIDFTPNYLVSRVRDPTAADTGLRRVRANITWTNPAP
jgi:Tfp pilus assembly protein PilW